MVMPSLDNGYWKKLGKKVGPKSEPLSLLYIATFLNKYGHNVEVLDCEAEGISLDELEMIFKIKQPDVVGVAMLTAMYSQSLGVCKLAKKVNPRIKVLVGGSHPTLRPKGTVAENDCIDVAAVGEAEITILDILAAFEGKKPLSDVKGIVFRDNGLIVQTEDRPKVQDLDFFPIPDRSLINLQLYHPSVSYYRQLPAYTMMTTRGCPYRCTFCATAKTGYRMHSIPRVIKEMTMLVEKYGAKEILIRDDTFTLNRQRTIDLCNAIIKAGLNDVVSWDCITRADRVDLELLKKMREAGCWGMHFGVEGGTQELIDSIHKDTTIETIKRAFNDCKKVGIETRGYFIIGLPGSTKEDDLATIEFAKEANPDWAQFTLCTPYPGTELFEQVHQDTSERGHNWDDYQTWSGFSEHELVWTPGGRSSDELKELQRRALKEFYFRPRVIAKKAFRAKNFPIIKKYVLGALALAAGGSGRSPE